MRHLRAVVATAGLVLAGGLPAAGLLAQSPPDFSGRWASSPDRFTTIAQTSLEGGGWQPHVSAVRAANPYVIAIHHAGDSITVTFPGGAGNVLNRPAFTIGAPPESVVWDRGDWWVTTESSASWDGALLTLTAVSQSAWWRDAEPRSATTRAGRLETTYVLALDETSAVLTMTVTVADEQGSATYRQQFRRLA